MLDLLYNLALFLFGSLAFSPLAFFFSTCPCCPQEECQGVCNPYAAPTTITVDIAGVTGVELAAVEFCDEGDRNCSDLDGTYVCTKIASAGDWCAWQITGIAFCQHGAFFPNFASLNAYLEKNGANTRLRVQFEGARAMRWDSAALGAFPIDCSALTTVSSTPTSDTSPGCSNATSTCDTTF